MLRSVMVNLYKNLYCRLFVVVPDRIQGFSEISAACCEAMSLYLHPVRPI